MFFTYINSFDFSIRQITNRNCRSIFPVSFKNFNDFQNRKFQPKTEFFIRILITNLDNLICHQGLEKGVARN